jgi:hypothetical protein
MPRSDFFSDRNHDDYNWLRVSDPSSVEEGLKEADQFEYVGESDGFTLYEGPAIEIAVGEDEIVEYGFFREVTEGTAWEFAETALSRSQDIEPDFQQEVQSYIEDIDGEVAADGGFRYGMPIGGGRTKVYDQEGEDKSGVASIP